MTPTPADDVVAALAEARAEIARLNAEIERIEDEDVGHRLLKENSRLETKLREKFPDWSVSFAEKIGAMACGEIVDICPLVQKEGQEAGSPPFSIAVLEYDFLFPSYTAWTPVSQDEAEELYRFWEFDPDNGREAWLCRYYRKVPYGRMQQQIERGGKWNCADLAAGLLPEALAALRDAREGR